MRRRRRRRARAACASADGGAATPPPRTGGARAPSSRSARLLSDQPRARLGAHDQRGSRTLDGARAGTRHARTRSDSPSGVAVYHKRHPRARAATVESVRATARAACGADKSARRATAAGVLECAIGVECTNTTCGRRGDRDPRSRRPEGAHRGLRAEEPMPLVARSFICVDEVRARRDRRAPPAGSTRDQRRVGEAPREHALGSPELASHRHRRGGREASRGLRAASAAAAPALADADDARGRRGRRALRRPRARCRRSRAPCSSAARARRRIGRGGRGAAGERRAPRTTSTRSRAPTRRRSRRGGSGKSAAASKRRRAGASSRAWTASIDARRQQNASLRDRIFRSRSTTPYGDDFIQLTRWRARTERQGRRPRPARRGRASAVGASVVARSSRCRRRPEIA